MPVLGQLGGGGVGGVATTVSGSAGSTEDDHGSKALLNGHMWRLWDLQLALLEHLFLAFYIWFWLVIHTFEIDC